MALVESILLRLESALQLDAAERDRAEQILQKELALELRDGDILWSDQLNLMYSESRQHDREIREMKSAIAALQARPERRPVVYTGRP